MARRPYVASNKSDPGAVPVMFGAAIAIALGVGLVEGFVSQWLSLLLIFPLLLGGAAGGGAVWAIKKYKIRMPMMAMLAAAVAGVLGEGAVHAMKYRAARAAAAESLENDPRMADYIKQLGLSGVVDVAFGGEEQLPAFIGYLRIAAENGITITSSHGSSSGSSPTLTGTGVYTLWAINFLCVIGMAVFIARAQAKEPFCEACNAWYGNTERLAVGDGGKPFKDTRRRFEEGQLGEAMRELGQSDGKSAAIVQLRCCATCNLHEPVLELKVIAGLKTNKPQEKLVFSTLVTASEAQSLRAAVAPPAA